MNEEFFKNWKNGVQKLNSHADEIIKGRDEAYAILSDEIKRIFADNGTVVDSIHFNNDASVIVVELTGDHSDEITFKKSFIDEIGMGFSVRRKLNALAQTVLYVTLYPLEED